MTTRFGTTGPDLNRLLSQLQITGLQQKDPVLFQLLSELIKNAIRAQKLLDDVVAGNSTNIAALLLIDFLTASDQSALLTNSRELLAGTGITFDDSIPNERTITSSGGSGDGVWTPLSDGDPDESDAIFNSFGEFIMVFVPNP